MNRLPLIFIGIFLTFCFGWGGLVIAPYIQFGKLQPFVDENTGDILPKPVSGLAQQGEVVYAQNGCVYCHTQQVRPDNQGGDIGRGWGDRPTVARDYIWQKTISLGTMRSGPDLANIGARQPDPMWHHLHLYNPQMTKGSTMPPFRYLYRNQKIVNGQRSPNALKLEGELAPPEGYEVVPSPEAEALVAYLISLNKKYALPEAPLD